MLMKELNLVSVMVIIILILYAIRGRQKGFIRIVFSMVSIVLALLTAAFLTPYISKPLQNNDAVMEFVTGVPEEREKQKEIQETGLPESILTVLLSGNTDEIQDILGIEEVQDYVKIQLGIMVINAGTFLLLYLIARLILWSVCSSLDIVSHLPVLNTLNKSAGIIAGALQGLITIWILCIVVNLFNDTETGKYILSCIAESSFLTVLYENNIFLPIIL